MKKLFAALAVCVSTVAFANNAQAPSAQQRKEGPKLLEATDLRSQKPGSSTKRAEAKAAKMDALALAEATGGSGQDNRTLGEKTKDALGLSQKDKEQKQTEEQTKNEALFKTSQAFNLSGTVKSASDKGLKLERAGGLPEADLEVRDQTVVMLDGKRVKADAIPEGASVRAKFNLDGSDLVAVHIDAKSNKGTGGAGAAGTETKAKTKSAKNATKDAAHDTQNAAKDAAHDAKNTAKDAAQDTQDAAHDATH